MKKPIKLTSFGIKNGKIEDSSIHISYDCRSLPNPYSFPNLKKLDGRDWAVQTYLFIPAMRVVEGLVALVRETAGIENIYCYCHGGRHRSVAVVELLAKELVKEGYLVEVHHRDIIK